MALNKEGQAKLKVMSFHELLSAYVDFERQLSNTLGEEAKDAEEAAVSVRNELIHRRIAFRNVVLITIGALGNVTSMSKKERGECMVHSKEMLEEALKKLS